MKMKKTAAVLMAAAMMTPSFSVLASEKEASGITPEVKPVSALTKAEIAFEPISEPQDVVELDVEGMFRLYNPNSGEHFYTSDANEKNVLAGLGWTVEGIGWYSPRTSDEPVYRLYNPNAGDHHYTKNLNEKTKLTDLGWKDEGIGWYSADDSHAPVYRQYNPNATTGTHNYTASELEDSELGKAGWSREGVAWYAIEPSAPAQNVMKDLETQFVSLDLAMRTNNASNLSLDGLDEKGSLINASLQGMQSLEDRYYAFQDGKLLGYSARGAYKVQIPEKTEGAILLIQPKMQKLQRAAVSENGTLSGLASAFGTGMDDSVYKAACGSMENGAFEGIAISYTLSSVDGAKNEELASGISKTNVMDGEIQMHTYQHDTDASTVHDYRWIMTVKDAKAVCTKEGNRYIAYNTPNLKVYFDYIPDNLHFWTEKW